MALKEGCESAGTRAPIQSHTKLRGISLTSPFPVAIPARWPRRSFLPALPSLAPRAGWTRLS